MKCRDFEDMILLQIDGTITESDGKAFTEHIETCEKCRLQYEKISAIYSSASSIYSFVPVNPQLANAVISEVETQKSLYVRSSWVKKYVLIPAATAAALFVGILLGTTFVKINSDIQEDYLVEVLSEQPTDNSENNPYNNYTDENEFYN